MFSEESDPPGDPFSEESDPFSEETIKPSTDGSFFIDRDGKHFHLILNYLRDGKVILPEGVTLLKEVEAEAKFYKINETLEEFDRRREAARRAQIVRDLMMDSDE